MVVSEVEASAEVLVLEVRAAVRVESFTNTMTITANKDQITSVVRLKNLLTAVKMMKSVW